MNPYKLFELCKKLNTELLEAKTEIERLKKVVSLWSERYAIYSLEGGCTRESMEITRELNKFAKPTDYENTPAERKP